MPGRILKYAIGLSLLVWSSCTTHREKMQHIRPLQSTDIVLDDLLTLNFSEARHFIRLVSESHPDFVAQVKQWQEQERNLLKSITHHVPLFEFWLPDKPNPDKSSRNEFLAMVSRMLENNQ